MSAILAVQLTATIVVPTLLNGTEPRGTILGVCFTAFAAALCVEALASPVLPFSNEPRPVRRQPAFLVLAIGIIAIVASTLAGQGSFAVQLGLTDRSPIAALFTPFTAWALFGAVLYVWQYKEGLTTKRHAMIAVGAVIATHAGAGLYRAILGQAASAIVTLLLIAVLMGLLRLRVLVAGVVALVLVWPTIYDFRNAARADLAGFAAVRTADDAMGRLQLDQQISAIGRFTPGSSGVDVPSPWTIVRTGLIPSVIDSSRPSLDTGSKLNVALGGSPLSSTSATFFGNVYIFEGLAFVGVASGLIALMMVVAMRRSRSPWAFMVAALIYQSALSFNATYPNGVASLLQDLEALVVAYAFVHLFPRRKVDVDPRPMPRSLS